MPALKNVPIPDTVTKIDEKAFYNCTALETINIPDAVTEIGRYAFEDCDALVTLQLPENLTSMGDGVFYGCDALKTMTVPGIMTVLEYKTFMNCPALESVHLPDTMTEIRSGAFRNSGLPGIAIPNSITSIGDDAFRDCDSLTRIEIPGSVKSLGSDSFNGCDLLGEVVLNPGLQTVYGSAFRNCDALTALSMPDTVTDVRSYALAECDLLASVRLSQNLTEIPSNLCSDDPALASIQIPYRVTKIGSNAFKNDTSLTDATLLEAVTSVGSSAFSYPDRTVIHGVSGTYAETWANANGFTFAPLGDVPVTAIHADPEELTLAGSDDSANITLTIEPENFTGGVFWETTTSGAEIIEIDEDGSGLITAREAGRAVVKITAGDMSIRVPVTVLQPVWSVYIEDAPEQLSMGESAQLTASIWPENATNKAVSWSSSDSETLSVDENGLVTALKKGSATITLAAMDGSGKKATCTIQIPNALYRVSGASWLESPHNYANNCSDIWELRRNGATWIEMTFDSRTNLEEEYDYLKITDGNGNIVGSNSSGYTGTELASQTIRVESNVVRLQLNSGRSGTEWGFKVVKVRSDGGADTAALKLPAALTRIDEEAFIGGHFASVALPDGVSSIGARAFANCGNLTDVYIPSMNVAIASDAFSGVANLTLHGPKGGAAEAFASANGYVFEED